MNIILFIYVFVTWFEHIMFVHVTATVAVKNHNCWKVACFCTKAWP